jgi:hypothetical protein
VPQYPKFKPSDFVIFSPSRAAQLNDEDMPPDAFYLVEVIEDKQSTFDFEILLSGPRALCEAIAISAAKKGQRVWFPSDDPSEPQGQQ